MVSWSLYVSNKFGVLSIIELSFQSCLSLELARLLQVTYLHPVWDLLLPMA